MSRRTKQQGQGTKAALRALAFVLCPLSFVPCSGCRHGRSDLVEAELRSRDHDLREVRDELHRSEAYNEALQREMRALRESSPSKLTPEQASQTYTLKSIVLGRQTGGFDDDEVPGDEALQVTVEPADFDNHAIKAPGTLHVTALEITPEGVKKPLNSWVVQPEDLRRRWRSGLLSTGYHVVLPWKVWPSTDRVRVVVQLALGDGRVFEADKDVTIRLAPPAYRKVVPGPVRQPGVEEIPLPQPRKLEPPTPDNPNPPEAQEARALKPGEAGAKVTPVQLLRPVPMRQRY